MDLQKLYFETVGAELAHHLQQHLTNAEEYGLTAIELHEAIPSTDKNFIWCKYHGCAFEQGTCGGECNEYKPINGRSGKCREKGILFDYGNAERFELNNGVWQKQHQ